MDRSQTKPKEKAFWVKTDAGCTDSEFGKLLGAFLFDALPLEQRTGFEKHLEECIACWTDVTNWGNLGLAAKDAQDAAARRGGKARSFRAAH